MIASDAPPATPPNHERQSVSVREAQAHIANLVQPLAGSERVRLFDALDRVLAEDLVSPVDVPPHDNAAMDGFAIRSADLRRDAAVVLDIMGAALAGQVWGEAVPAGQCVRIMTGAMMPAGTDTVVPQELVETSASTITVRAGLVQAGDNRRCRGEDLGRGDSALRKGERLKPAALGLAASLGLDHLPVRPRLRVAYFSTGDEILDAGAPPRPGAIYDSNRYTVWGLLRRMGCEVLDLGAIPDDPLRLKAAFRQAAATADVVITSGGVSVGEADYTKALMRELGEVVFWTIAMRPGRPLAVGRIGNTLLFGLPGNPVAVMVTFLVFVRPALRAMLGEIDHDPPLLRARSLEAIRKKPGRTEYQRGVITTGDDGSPAVRVTGNQGSGVLSSMVKAHGLIVLHHDEGPVQPGDLVDVLVFDGAI